MNYAESFEQFSARLSTMDLVLYAGAGIIIYTLFKEKLGPIKNMVLNLFQTAKNKTSTVSNNIVSAIPAAVSSSNKSDLFFDLVASWKRTRDLAVQNNCAEAVKVADQMFPYLSPTGCSKDTP